MADPTPATAAAADTAAGAGAAPMPDEAPDDAELRALLRRWRTVAVVGLSADWHRPSHFAASYLQQHGYRVVPVNPRAPATILGQTCYARLQDIPFAVDVVDIFRRTDDVPPIAEAAIAIGARCLWQQLGVDHRAADAQARAAGLVGVRNRCMKIEHARLFGGLHWAGVNTGVVSSARRR